jgi:hypothetical protein
MLHKVYDKEKTIEVLLNVCKHNHDQYKKILEAIEEDGTNAKRMRMYTYSGLFYNEICLQKL